MANTVIQKNGTHKRQERYADAIVKLMRQQFNIRAEFSRDYEGNPTAGAVEVPTRNGDKRNIIQKTDALLRPKDIVVIKDKIIAKQI